MSGDLERFDPVEQRGRIAYEHFHRYALCKTQVAGRRVLDLACGTGYGTAILGGSGAEVTGLDISAAAIGIARKRHGSKNVKFVIGDCFDLPFEAASFDVVVANEMIEHIHDHDALLMEAKRVLRPGGLLLISTPNKPVYNRYKTPNPFHVSEMDLPDFRALLSRHFAHVQLTGTRMALVSVGYALDGEHGTNVGAARVFAGSLGEGGQVSLSEGTLAFQEPEYVLAVCSDQTLTQADWQSSLFFDPKDDLWLEHERIMAWASGLHEEDEILRADVVRTRKELEYERAQLESVRAEHAQQSQFVADLRHVHATLAETVQRERDTLAGQAASQRRMLARLLAQTSGKAVDDEDGAIISGLFDVNAALVEERLRREMAERVVARQETDLREGREARALAEAQAARYRDVAAEREAQLAQTSALLQEAKNARDELEGRLGHIEEEATRLREQIATHETQLSAAEQQILDLATAREALNQALTQSNDQLTGLQDRVAEYAKTAARRAKFMQVHRQIADQLANASKDVAGRIPPAPSPQPRRWHQQLRGLKRTFDTSIFNRDWLERQRKGAGQLDLRSYLARPDCWLLQPHPLFDAAAYAKDNPDVVGAGVAPLAHFLEHGWREGRNPHALFASHWYLAQNPDVLADGTLNPLDHYLQYGWREGRWPNPLFNPRSYLERYRDVAEAGVEPLTHFLMYGRSEGRELGPLDLTTDAADLPDTGDGADGVMRYLLTTPARATAEEVAKETNPWPPQPLDDFWPTAAMREFVQESYGDAALALCWYLLSLMNKWQEQQSAFAASEDCRALLEHIRAQAARRAAPSEDELDATIIIPVYNNLLDTLICLTSLLEFADGRHFDVIVADDGSADATAALIGSIGGAVRYIRQPQNLGFLGNCNAAALHARGRHIVLLNNDTIVLPGWLDGLLAPFDQFQKVGLVGSRLINWDGTLQEAGGIFWKDGSAWNFGRNQDPRAPAFNYVKDADYCSGASIAIPRAVWQEVGGFDPLFTPAYCEDSDLAFRLRQQGYRTLYSPASTVVHHEGRSHGRDVGSGIKAYQVTNTKRLLERWRDTLERDHAPNGQDVLRARDHSFNQRHVLIIDHYVPQWDKDAGSRSIYEFMRVLREAGHMVSFWPDNLWRDPDYTPKLQALGIEVIYGPAFRDGLAQFMQERSGLYDMVLLSRPHIASQHLATVREHSDARIVYYGHDVHFRRMMAQRELEGRPAEDAEVNAMKAQELSVCQQSDLVLYPSEDEAALMQELLGGKVPTKAIAAYRFSDTDLQAARGRADTIRTCDKTLKLLFVGGFAHPPNADAIVWFCEAVLPRLSARGLEVSLSIVGSKAGPEIRALARPGIDVLGFVSDADLLRLYQATDVVVAPLRYGAGVKGKVIEAMARGVPVVTTDVGAQGIANAQELLFVGNTPDALADAIAAASDPEIARQKAQAAIAYIAAYYSTTAMREVLEAGLDATPHKVWAE